MDITSRFQYVCSTPSDINEHLSYLSNLTTSCKSVLECGVRSVVSSWAFLHGLVNNGQPEKTLHSCDIVRSSNIAELEQACNKNGVAFQFHECSDLNLSNTNTYDLVFIDTWHVYPQLKAELEKFHKLANKYIAMHDTTVDGVHGETIRCGWNPHEQSRQSGFPVDEILCGLQRAIDEFLAAHPEWKVKEVFTHNNGLTVLEKSGL